MTTLRIAARRLAEQVHRRGDLHFHYDRAVLGEEGIAAQRRLAATGAWQQEVAVNGEFALDAYTLKVRGRIDLLDETAALPTLVEVKSTRTDLSRLHAHLGGVHLAQLKLYAHMYAAAKGWRQLRLRVQYVHLDSQDTTPYDCDCSADELQDFFRATCTSFLTWRAALDEWRSKRDAAAKLTPFPFDGYRPGQRALAAAAFRGHRDSTPLICEAPTGLGKTAATLFPALQAMAHGHTDRVLYLTARGTGQAAAVNTLRALRTAGAALRQVQIIAKEKVCLTPGAPCAPETCTYAAGHFDRAPAALLAVNDCTEVGALELQQIGRAHHVCPFELSLAAARWADVVICDYNYVLDPVIRSASVVAEGARRTSVLIDEAHQLPDRTREMYSATLSRRGLLAAVKVAGKVIGRAVDHLAKTMKTLLRAAGTGSVQEGVLIADETQLARALLAFNEACAPEIGADSAPALMEAYFHTSQWRSLDYMATVTPYAVIARVEADDLVFVRYCIDPAIPAALALKPFRSVQAFSGTLPGEQRLGLPGRPKWLRLGSPFPSEHLGVFLVRDLSVYFRDRANTVARLAGLVCDLCAARSGNYLVFVPSFAYVELLSGALAAITAHAAHGVVADANAEAAAIAPSNTMEIFAQTRQMDDAKRSEFIARFADDGTTRLGIAATGGVFSESVDLAGDRLIGVIVVGIALPPRSLERELVREACGEQGDAHAYQYPALIRVLQTAGRLIRAASDRGVLCLVDARFAAQPYRQLLPGHWQIQQVPCREVGNAAARFWASTAVATSQRGECE